MNNPRPRAGADPAGARPCPNVVRPEKVAAARRSLQADRYEQDQVIDEMIERLYVAITSPGKDSL